MSKQFFIPDEEKLGSINMAIDTIHQLLFACMEYRNIAIELGATKDDMDAVKCYFDEEEFPSKVEMAVKDLCYLYLNALSLASYQPKEKAKKIGVPKANELGINYFLTPQRQVPKVAKRDFIKRFIEGNESFPADISKELLSDMDYADFLKTPYWKSIALYIKERDGKKCSICGATKTLEAHHLTYDNHGDELHHLEDLTCICRKCHENLHTK